jgi:hypothetical protein
MIVVWRRAMRDKTPPTMPAVEGREGWRIREEILKKIRGEIDRKESEDPFLKVYLLGLEAGELLQQPRNEEICAALAKNFQEARKLGVVIDLFL